MGDKPGGHAKVIDLFGELAHVTLVSTGCFAGWKLGGTFLTLLAGGVTARVAWFFCWGVFHLVVGHSPSE